MMKEISRNVVSDVLQTMNSSQGLIPTVATNIENNKNVIIVKKHPKTLFVSDVLQTMYRLPT